MKHKHTAALSKLATLAHTYNKVLLLGTISILAIQFVATALSPSAQAATAPDTCFAFTAASGTITDYYNNQANNTANPACPREIDIPSSIGGSAVTAIGINAFRENQLTNISIPNSVTVIGSNAFRRNQLTTVTIPNSVTTIASGAFYDNQISSIDFGESLVTIGGDSFNMNDLTSITIPDTVTTIGGFSFANNRIADVILGNSVATIGNSAFMYNSINAVTIPNTVTSIGNSAFLSNRIRSLSLPSSVSAIGTNAFMSNALEFVIVYGNPSIGSNAFNHNRLFDTNPDGITDATFQENGLLLPIYSQNSAFTASHSDTFYRSPYRPSNGYITGGYLINPAPLTVNYVNAANTALQTPVTIVGANPAVTDYKIASILNGSDPTNPTLDFAGAEFYRIGQTVTPTLPIMDGFITPETRAISLVNQTNQATFTYLTQANADAGVTINLDGTPSVPNTGLQAMLQSPVFIALVGVVATAILLSLYVRRKSSVKN